MTKGAVLLKRARIKKGWDQADLATLVGRSRSLVAAWETGRSVPKREDGRKLKELLGIKDSEWGVEADAQATGGRR